MIKLPETRKTEFENIEKEIKMLEQKKEEVLNNILDELGLNKSVKFKFENDKNVYMVVNIVDFFKQKRGYVLLKKDGTRNLNKCGREFTFYQINKIEEIL